MLNNKALSLVTNAKISGQYTRFCDNNKDISVKRGIIISKINSVVQEFNFAQPRTKRAVMQKYCTSGFLWF